jgi:competence protein ComEC
MNRPIVFFTCFYITGVLFGEFTRFKATTAMVLAAFCLLIVMAGHILNWRGNRRAVLVLFLLLGLVLSRLGMEESKTPLVQFAGQRIILVGQVSSGPDVRADQVIYQFKAHEVVRGEERHPVSGAVRLQVKECNRVFSYGDILEVSGLLIRPATPGNPGAFNYRTYLEREGIHVILLARGEDSLVKTGAGGINPLISTALAAKQKLAAAATHSLTPAQAAVLNGIVFGSQGLIDQETRQAFSETGIVHILSVSGLHVGLVLGGLMGFLGLFRAPPACTAPLVTPVLLFYALMTGLNPAVLRATFMALLFVWAHHLGRDRDWPTTLALAALIILIWKPLQIYNPGFQLSFTATWGILYLGPLLAAGLARLLKGLSESAVRVAAPGPRGDSVPQRGISENFVRVAALALAVPLAAQLATVPLVAWYYNLFSPVSIPANLLAAPLVGLILLLGILAAILGLFWLPLAGLLNASTGVVLDLFLALVALLQELPGAVIYLATPPVLLAAVWYGGLFLVAGICSGVWSPAVLRRFKNWTAVGAALGVVLLLIWWPWSGGGQKLIVHFIDVGQGDCSLVQTPGGRNMLIDTGGWREEFLSGTGAGSQVVAPYLRRIGVRRLDVLVLTHPHEDHAGGAAYLVKNFPVILALVPPAALPDGSGEAPGGETAEEIPAAFTALMKNMEANGIPVEAAGAGDSLALDSMIDLRILSPGEMRASEASLNNISLVLKLTYKDRAFLFTGDVELEAQRKLLERGEELEADVLKMPHHGSRTLLPELVQQVQPEIAVIQVGAHNTFGHPAPSTLELLEHSGAAVYRNDLDGAVIIETDGYGLQVRTGAGAY